MRKLLAAGVACLLCCAVTFAQSKKGKAVFSFKAGFNVSTFRTAVNYTDFDPAWKAGYAFGGAVEIPISKKFSFEPEFLYSQMGSRGSSSAWGTVKFRHNYFSVPLIVKYKVSKDFTVLGGPQSDFLIRARKKDFFKTTTITNDIRDYDLGFTAGIESYFSERVSIGARYIHGIRDVSLTPDESTFFNQGVQLSLGYKIFGKGKKAKAQK